jgi:hypothetical protein
MAVVAFFKFGCGLAVAISTLLGASSTLLAQDKLDVSNLKKGDKLEMKVDDEWVLVEFDKKHTDGVIIVRRKGVDQPMIAFTTMVRLPPGGAAKKDDAAPPKPRTWTDRTGKFKIVATLVKVVDGKVILKRKSDGKQIAVALEKLGDADQKYIKSTEAPKPSPPGNSAQPPGTPVSKDAPQPNQAAEPKNAEPRAD